MSTHTDEEARAQELLLASELDLPGLLATTLEEAPDMGWLGPVLDADPARARLALAIALDAAERGLAADTADESAATRLATVAMLLADVSSKTGDVDGSRRILAATREALGDCGWDAHQKLLFAQLFELVLEQHDVELVCRLAEELLRIPAVASADSPFRPLLSGAAGVAYYEAEDLALALRCAEPLRPDPAGSLIAGFVFQREEEWEKALEVWEELAKIEAGPGIPLNRIVVLAKLGREEQARSELDELLDRNPDYWKGLVQRSLLELEQPGGDPRPNLEEILALAVRKQLEPEEIGETANQLALLAMRHGHVVAVAEALAVLEEDARDEVQGTALFLRGHLLTEQGLRREAADAFRGAIEVLNDEGPPVMRMGLVDALLADGQTEAAIEAIEPLVELDGMPREASSRLAAIEATKPSLRVRLLRAKADYALDKLAPAEAAVNEILAEEPTNSVARRLRSMVRLSTSMRPEEREWDEAADPRRYLEAIEDLGRTAHEGDAEATRAYRWAVDRARAEPFLNANLGYLRGEDGRPDHYDLIDGLEEVDRIQAAAFALIAERKWSEAAQRVEEARQRLERIGMPVDAGRMALLLADLALRRTDPRDALRRLDDPQELIALQLTPLDERLARRATEMAAADAAHGRPSLVLPAKNVAFLTRTVMSNLTYRTLLRVQALSALGRHRDALGELGDETTLLDRRERLGLGAIDGGETVRAVMAILRDAGEPERALALRERALVDANSSLLEASILVTCAGCLITLGDREKALATLEEARAVEGGLDLQQMRAVVDHTEATIQLASNPGRVVELLTDEVVASLGPPARRAAGLMLKAEALEALGRPAEAEEAARRTEELADDHLASVPLAGDQSVPQQAWQRVREVRCGVAAGRGETEKLMVLLGGLKGRTLSLQQTVALGGPSSRSPLEATVAAERDDLLALISYAMRHDGTVSWLHLHALGEVGESLVDRSTDGGPKLDLGKARAALTDARDRLEALQVRAGELPARPAVDEPFDLTQVREMLAGAPAGTVLVDVFLDRERCYLNGLTTGAEPWTVAVACGEPEIRALASEAREREDWSDDNPVWGDERLGRIVDAIHEKTPAGGHVVVLRHGPLHEVPLHAVAGTAGMLSARNTISYAPGMGALLSCRAEQPAGGKAIVIADSLEDLPNARLEGQSVAEQMGVPALIGFQADRRRLLAALQERAPSLLHVACHGLFDEADPDASRLALAAGAVDLDEGRDTDLTGREIARLPLQGSVVVLSACHSGVSALKPGDEPFGLTRAFLTAGARTLVAARWAVDDISTWLLMGKFTALRRGGLTVVQALADSQRWVREMTTAEVTDQCEAALRAGGAGSAAVLERLNRRYGEGLEMAGRREAGAAAIRTADLLAKLPGSRSAPDLPALAAGDRPYADREFWAAFEVVGDWV